MCAMYAVGREGFTVLASPAPVITVKSAANVIGRVNEVGIGGEATASTVLRPVVRRSTTDGITPTAQTPAKLSSSAPAAQCTSATAFSTNAVVAAAPAIWTYAMNAFGGIIRWVAAVGQELLIQGATAGNDEIGLYGAAGTPIISSQLTFEEI